MQGMDAGLTQQKQRLCVAACLAFVVACGDSGLSAPEAEVSFIPTQDTRVTDAVTEPDAPPPETTIAEVAPETRSSCEPGNGCFLGNHQTAHADQTTLPGPEAGLGSKLSFGGGDQPKPGRRREYSGKD